VLRKPITGIAGCCAFAPSGHATAAPLISEMNSRRLIDALKFNNGRLHTVRTEGAMLCDTAI
jgi:hypothetical protein